jgi:hypothetical protein
MLCTQKSLKEDPRYYRLGSSGTKGRLFHALEHCVAARKENGAMTFDFSEWLRTTSALAGYRVSSGGRTRRGAGRRTILSQSHKMPVTMFFASLA